MAATAQLIETEPFGVASHPDTDFDAFLNVHSLVHDPGTAYELARLEDAARDDTAAFAALREEYHERLAAIWRPEPLPKLAGRQLVAMANARTAEAAKIRAEQRRPRDVLVAAGGLLTAAACVAGGAYGWLKTRSSLSVPPFSKPELPAPHTPPDPHLVADMAIRPVGEGLQAMVALTGEIGMGLGATTVLGATAVALSLRQRNRQRRDAAALTVLSAASEASLERMASTEDQALAEPSLTDSLMAFGSKRKTTWRQKLARAAGVARALVNPATYETAISD